jgi:hypothetical protein
LCRWDDVPRLFDLVPLFGDQQSGWLPREKDDTRGGNMSGKGSKNVLFSSFVSGLFFFLIVFSPFGAFASSSASVSGQIAELNWNGLNPELPGFWVSSDSGQTIGLWLNQVSTVQSRATVDSVQKSSSGTSYWDWTEPHSAVSPYSGSEGSVSAVGSTTATFLSFTTNTASHSRTVEAYAQGARVSWFQVSGSGTLTFTFPYSVHYQLSRDDSSDMVAAYTRPRAELTSFGQVLYDWPNTTSVTTPWDIYETWFLAGSAAMEAEGDTNGTMVLSMHFNDKDWGYFSVSANGECSAYTVAAANPVPLPPSLLLLAPSLMGLVAMRRRYKR